MWNRWNYWSSCAVRSKEKKAHSWSSVRCHDYCYSSSADHIFKNAVRLSPIPYPANFLRNKASAFFRMRRNDPADCSDILLCDRSSPICYDCFHTGYYNALGTGTQIFLSVCKKNSEISTVVYLNGNEDPPEFKRQNLVKCPLFFGFTEFWREHCS